MTEGIEIPTGTFDPEIISWTYIIPEGFTAKIEDGKIIVEKKESEDEKIRQEMVEFLDELWHLGKNTNFDRWGKADCAKWIAYLEKQKGQTCDLFCGTIIG